MDKLEDTLLFESRCQQAKDLMGSLISLRSAWWSDEHHQESPDEARMQRLADESLFLYALQRHVVLMSTEEIARLIEQYRPQLIEESRIRHEHEAARKGT